MFDTEILDAMREAKKDGATVYAEFRVQGDKLFSLSFFHDAYVDDRGCLFEVGVWLTDMKCYSKTNRYYDITLIKGKILPLDIK